MKEALGGEGWAGDEGPGIVHLLRPMFGTRKRAACGRMSTMGAEAPRILSPHVKESMDLKAVFLPHAGNAQAVILREWAGEPG